MSGALGTRYLASWRPTGLEPDIVSILLGRAGELTARRRTRLELYGVVGKLVALPARGEIPRLEKPCVLGVSAWCRDLPKISTAQAAVLGREDITA